MELMKIKRTIHGEEVEIELTWLEMCDAREKVQIENLREDIEDIACGYLEREIPPEDLDEMAEQAWNYLIYNDMSLREARDCAIDNYETGCL